MYAITEEVARSRKLIRFYNLDGTERFYLESGKHLAIQFSSGLEVFRLCKYIDNEVFRCGGNVYRITEFASYLEKNKCTCAPKEMLHKLSYFAPLPTKHRKPGERYRMLAYRGDLKQPAFYFAIDPDGKPDVQIGIYREATQELEQLPVFDFLQSRLSDIPELTQFERDQILFFLYRIHSSNQTLLRSEERNCIRRQRASLSRSASFTAELKKE